MTLAAESVGGEESEVADLSSDWKVDFVGDKNTVNEAKLTDWWTIGRRRATRARRFTRKRLTWSAKPAGAVYLEVEGGSPVGAPPNSPPEHAPAGGSPVGTDGMPNRAVVSEPAGHACRLIRRCARRRW